jgi:fructose-bisphosphate aldolase, class I
MKFEDMHTKVATGQGFIAALDQSGGSTPKALAGYGHTPADWSDDTSMFALIHAMRARIIASPAFTGDRVIGAILFERTMDGVMPDGASVPAALAAKGIVPFLKIDKGLEDEAHGVQMMKPIDGLHALLARAKALSIYGTKERSVVHHADPSGIAAIVAQQIAVAQQVLAAGMMPILEPEVNIKSESRAECDGFLLAELDKQLTAMPGDAQVMLKLSLPVQPGHFDALVDHPRVLRVVALSGGYNRPEACAELSKNRGIIASFSRALLEDLRVQMDDVVFDTALDAAVQAIFVGSTQKQ